MGATESRGSCLIAERASCCTVSPASERFGGGGHPFLGGPLSGIRQAAIFFSLKEVYARIGSHAPRPSGADLFALLHPVDAGHAAPVFGGHSGRLLRRPLCRGDVFGGSQPCHADVFPVFRGGGHACVGWGSPGREISWREEAGSGFRDFHQNDALPAACRCSRVGGDVAVQRRTGAFSRGG